MQREKINAMLNEWGLTSDNLPKPGGSYQSVNVRGNIAYVSIQFPILKDNYLFRGKLGKEITSQEGANAARLCAVNVIAQVHKYVGFEKIGGLNHFDFYYQAAEGWDEGPLVADGASDLFVSVLESTGFHTRAIFGVYSLPRNFCVGVTTSFTLIDFS